MTPTFRRLLTAVALLAAVAASVTASPASAQTPCWKTLINDWFDGRIDGTYPIPCYREAIKHLPTDVKSYSSAREDINQALQLRLTQSTNPGDKTSTNDDTNTTTTGTKTTPGGKTSTRGDGEDDESDQGVGPRPGDDGPRGPGDTTAGPKGRDDPNAMTPAAGSADSVPIPLIVLGALAALLMAAGAAGFIARRARTRRMEVAAASAVAERSRETPPPGT